MKLYTVEDLKGNQRIVSFNKLIREKRKGYYLKIISVYKEVEKGKKNDEKERPKGLFKGRKTYENDSGCRC